MSAGELIQELPQQQERHTIERNFGDRFALWLFQNRLLLLIVLSAVLQGIFVRFFYVEGEVFDSSKLDFQEISFMTDIRVAEPVRSLAAEGEIQEVDKLKKAVDPRIASAANPYLLGAQLPVDLTPQLSPTYTAAARSAGVEGTVVLQLVIADTGEVLDLRVISKHLGHGLEQAVLSAFRQKKFRAARHQGKPVTVRMNYPVRFRLDG